ncbi:TlpA family protein disulfide reductase [Tenacibaculum aquimarinum]|uniref:TlpA family protein disulfide reductase n=1 Tax=Tenacibaculum aquimarinum TaxID=2910675 RepID=UPI001F0B1219|nr:redoxin domain-containing protein [Tenacibaculum aquimarinum]MCH3883484.1 peroxiredoxin family protein [Tenacibaculum aquimarinum]
MKKKIKLFILFLLVCILGFLGYKITRKLNHKKEVVERIKTTPSFSFKTIENLVYTEKDLPNVPVVFVYFNSECEFCKTEASKIQSRLTDFKNVQLVFVSFEKKETIESFASVYKLDNQENVLFLEDKKGLFSEIFDVNSIPYIVVYNKDKELLKKFKGATKVDDILAVLK